jgi:heme exporter protein D
VPAHLLSDITFHAFASSAHAQTVVNILIVSAACSMERRQSTRSIARIHQRQQPAPRDANQ